MAKWKLTRQNYGDDEFTLSEGDEITIGRGADNTISLSSLVISRQHCILKVKKDKITIQDLKSSNGTYLGSKKIPPNIPVDIKESECLGIGWSDGVDLVNVNDKEKYVFKLVRDKVEKSLSDRITFQNDDVFEDIEKKLALTFDNDNHIINVEKDELKSNDSSELSMFKTKLSLKRKSMEFDKIYKPTVKSIAHSPSQTKNPLNVISLLSDSENETNNKNLEVSSTKKVKLEPISEKMLEHDIIEEKEIKTELNYNEFDAFNIKQEILGYDEPIHIDSDSDSDSESERRWLSRLSQSGSPGKTLANAARNDVSETALKDSSYSQIVESNQENIEINLCEEYFSNDLIKIPIKPFETELEQICGDEVDGYNTGGISSDYFAKQLENKSLKHVASPEKVTQNEGVKRTTLMIEPIAQTSRRKSQHTESKQKITSLKHSKSRKDSFSKRHISDMQKEERKKKLKEIASKEKDLETKQESSKSKSKVNVKVTNSNRGAFLTEMTSAVKPSKKKEGSDKCHKDDNKQTNNDQKTSAKCNLVPVKDAVTCQDIENSSIMSDNEKNKCLKSQSNKKEKYQKHSNRSSLDKDKIPKHTKHKLPIKNKTPLIERSNDYAGKPVSKVEPLPVVKPKKMVKFSDDPPQIKIFQIEPGNQMKKTSLVKATLLDSPRMPSFSVEKIALIKILRWNPQWLNEQINNNEPPPILGHNSPPLSVLHYFHNHTQYVQVVGDLLLMEIWECVTQAYMRKRNQDCLLQMSIEHLSPVPEPEQFFDIFNLSVNVSVPKVEVKSLPRVGELMLVTFGPENDSNNRFFYVHNVRCLPSPPNNKYSYFSVSLHSVFTDKMRSLRRGEVILGKTLTYIKNELALFDAMEYLARSPLCEAILRPDPRHFPKKQCSFAIPKSPWTATLNESQLEAVSCSVSAALSEKPSLQMIQGPPGTGKSSVICSIIMSYFYDHYGKKQQNRGKVLICATSNAAVDELVIRLLLIRQSLPKNERFRMVRVGRPESMHPKARDLSSQSLAQRDTQRYLEPAQPGLSEEIARLEARLNMWRCMTQEAKDPARMAFCQNNQEQIKNKINQLRGSSQGDISAEQLANAERRIVEGADIIVTTLASAANNKMRGLRRRIALCIVDEAGQAIEPETLIPLTLDVTKLTLIGDPQQLPGFICSQRAKQHGLAESLFSRLSTSFESWEGASPVVLLNMQYRMHPMIADYPNRAFYDSKIQNAGLIRNDHQLPPYSVVYISSGDKGQGVSGANEMEAWGVARLVVALNSVVKSWKMNIAVITPYNAHKDLVKKNLKILQEPDAAPIEVNTVDSFQGQERDVVVVSLARSQGVGFLTDTGRMNVMLTRAKHSLLICLNPHAMLKNQQWRTLMDDAQQRNLYCHLPNRLCQAASASQIDNEDILKYITRNCSGPSE